MNAKDKIKILSGHLEETDIMIINKAIEEAHKAGIREVVGWIETEDAIDRMERERWQAKLKEWGIE